MNSTLQIRIDEKVKKKARKVFADMGLDMSSGVKLFLQHVVNTETLPFVPRTKNGFTSVQEKQMLQEVAETLEKKHVGHTKAHDLHKAILES